MMKVLLIFANSSVKKATAFPEELRDILQGSTSGANADMQIYITFAKSLSFLISNEQVKIRDHKNHFNLEEYDLVYFRKAGTVMQQMQVCAQYLNDHGIPFFDTELLKANSRNKLTQMYMLQKNNLPIPKTLFCRNNRRLLRLVSKRYQEHFNFPVIAKATGGTRGDANYLLKNIDELNELLLSDKRHFLIQEFIENDGDYRFFIAGGALSGVIGRKSSSGSHLNNTSKGASAKIIPSSQFPETIRADALFSARIFGREVAGVDIIIEQNTGKHYILEVNRAPQIEQSSFEKEKGKWLVTAFENAIADFQPSTPNIEWQNRPAMGRFEAVYVKPQDGSEPFKMIAKVDTGADSSSTHCENLRIDGNTLRCKIGAAEFEFKQFFTKIVRPSTGKPEERYLVEIDITIGGRPYKLKTTLNDRSRMSRDMLIGRRFLRSNHFVVDVSRRFIQTSVKTSQKENV